jgi:DNA processing protein
LDYLPSREIDLRQRDGAFLMSLTITTLSEARYAPAADLMKDFAPSKQHQLLAFTDTFQSLFNARSSDFDAPISTEIACVQQQLQRIEWRSRSAAILSECQQLGVRLLAVTEDDYPPLLKQIAVPPPILFVLGDDTNLHLPLLAVVGSRRMTSGGARNAHLWSRHLTTCGFTITSGLALGVDGVADEAAIEVEGGRTVAINHWPSGSSLVVVV